MTLAGKEVMDIKKGVIDIEKGVTHARKDMMPIRRAGQAHVSQASSCRGHRAARMALVCSSMARPCGGRPAQLSHTCPHVWSSPTRINASQSCSSLPSSNTHHWCSSCG